MGKSRENYEQKGIEQKGLILMDNYEQEIMNKIENGIKFDKEELKELIWLNQVAEIEGDEHRWYREIQTIFEINDRYFAIDWQRGLTEYQENEYSNQPYEVKPVEKVITITLWERMS